MHTGCDGFTRSSGVALGFRACYDIENLNEVLTLCLLVTGSQTAAVNSSLFSNYFSIVHVRRVRVMKCSYQFQSHFNFSVEGAKEVRLEKANSLPAGQQ